MRRSLLTATALYFALAATSSAAPGTRPGLRMREAELPGFSATRASVSYARTGEQWALALGDSAKGLEARAMLVLHFQRGVVERFKAGTHADVFYAAQMFRTRRASRRETARRDEKLFLGQKDSPGFVQSTPSKLAAATLFSEFAAGVGGTATVAFTVGRCSIEVSEGVAGITSPEQAAAAPLAAADHLSRRLHTICG